MNGLQNKQKKIGLFLSVLAIFVVSSFCMRYDGKPKTVDFLGIEILNVSLMGVCQSIIYLLAILMVCIDYKIGKTISILILIILDIRSVIIIALTGNYGPLPGVVNGLISIFSILLISTFFAKAEKAKYTDELTGALNKSGFLKEVDRLIDKGKFRYVIFLKLKNFRSISDRLGHDYGDAALKTMTERMKEVVSDDGIVCRIDGTEFAIGVHGYIGAGKLCTRLIDRISECLEFTIDEASVKCYINAFAGVASYPDDASDSKTLLKYADIAMYNVKEKHTSNIGYFNANALNRITKQVETVRLIKDSLENNYFYLVYQPQYTVQDKKLRGFETLIRCKLPNQTIVSPGDFIPVAEQTDLIQKIDEYVLERAMREFKPVLEKTGGKYIISVNVSAKSMSDKDFVDKLALMLEKTGFPPYALEIEITEYSLAESREQTIENVTVLRKLGIHIALDDFGTGYTSLAQLVNLPINVLKIDKSLIDDINSKDSAIELIEAVIYMGHLMDCYIISEGVEKQEQVDILKKHKCDFIQGYVWGKPMDYEEALKLVK